VLTFAEESLIDFWATKMRPSVASAHRLYVEGAKIRHPTFAPITKPTFKAMAARIRQIAAKARGGLRAENAAASPTDVEDRAMTPTRPFEVAAVDHCLLKVYCVLLRTEEYVYVCRPWITVLRDLYTGEPLAWWVSFSDPSRRAIAMVIRSCLRRHGRLPETIQVDRGSDFRSVYQSSICAHFGIHLAIRPTTNSRFGGKIERIFNTFKTMWLDLRPGNCTDIRKLRSLSGSHHPANLPCLTLPSLLAEIGDFFSWFCTQKLEQAATPSLLRNEGLARFPFSGKSMT
jgi:putative transposase